MGGRGSVGEQGGGFSELLNEVPHSREILH